MDNGKNSGFHTLRGYNRMEHSDISFAMEDYLEMICRHTLEGEIIRVNRLASLLHVTPPSASKMVMKLKESGLVSFEPYGIITLTQAGEALGGYLLYRHDILHRFFMMLNRSEDELELVEKIEHYMDRRTIENMEKLLRSKSGGGNIMNADR
ncbi:MAG: metal-dependent transcriptional regulator [Oscillospiraceae bacterium]|nr:metal-dependent transcriptional regulator [Oscillospiraceae bacterium]